MALSNTQYEQIMRGYQARSLQHRKELDRRREEVRGKLPRIEEIEQEAASLSVRKAKILLSVSKEADFSLDQALADLADEKNALLLSSGFPADYLEMTYDCPCCRDTGYIDRRKCSCFLQKEIALLYDQSNLKQVTEKENFTSFSLDRYPEEGVHPVYGQTPRAMAALALQTSMEFADHFSEDGGNLLFQGKTGVGKTFLSHCIAGELIRQGHSVLYLSSYDLFDLMRKYTFESPEKSRASYRQILDCELLIIDDLGTELNNSFVSSQLFLCVNERLLSGKSTIISTNLSLRELKELYTERVFSRIASSYKLLHLIGSDVRF